MISRRICLLPLALTCAALAGCFDDDPAGGGPTPSPTPTPSPGPVQLDFAFAPGGVVWQTGFADYSPGMESSIDFRSGLATVPPNLTNTTGLLLGGTNVSNDLAMFAWHKVGNLQPSTPYRIAAQVEIATNAPANCVGIGGPPGESVWIKAGADNEMPTKVTMNGRVTVNVD